MVVLPVTNDQPGVGARVAWSGAGRSIPVGRLTAGRLSDAVCTVLGDPSYRERAEGLRSQLTAADGLNRAADLIEAAFGSSSKAVPSDAAVRRRAQPGGSRPGVAAGIGESHANNTAL
jgi:UDP:flavonoid glycosyltransferase YjiC (YdhE family)